DAVQQHDGERTQRERDPEHVRDEVRAQELLHVEERADGCDQRSDTADDERAVAIRAELVAEHGSRRHQRSSSPGNVASNASRMPAGSSSSDACWLRCSTRIHAAIAQRSAGGTRSSYEYIAPKPRVMTSK